MMSPPPYQQIRALFDDKLIRVYQAYSDRIADSALENGTFISPPFKLDRMTWIKPSFLWMMYRSQWGRKDPEQKRILAIDITREGFDWALANSCPSRPEPSMGKAAWQNLKQKAPVRIQWDPERDLFLRPLPYRTIQIGLGKEASTLYVSKWIRKITDVTETADLMYSLIENNKILEAKQIHPKEKPYPF